MESDRTRWTWGEVAGVEQPGAGSKRGIGEMRAGRLLIVLGCLAGLLTGGCCSKCPKGSVEPPPPRYVTLYSCDNVERLGRTPCHAPDDSEYMMIEILEYVPASRLQLHVPEVVARFRDPGDGVTLRVWNVEMAYDILWYKVQYQDKQGWVSSLDTSLPVRKK